MDNLTHTLAGAVLGEAGLKRRTALAMPTLMIGANLPDIDVVALLFGHGLSFRRGWTHGALALVVLPLVLTAAVLAWDRYFRRRGGRNPERVVLPGQVLLLSFIAVFSHPLLDWLNTYGLRWLMPFDGRWFYGDALFIIDPWVWLLLAFGVLAARYRARPGVAVAVAGVSIVYIIFMLGTAAAGRSIVASALRAEGIEPYAVMVGPVPVDPTRRSVIVASGAVYYTAELRWLPRPILTIDEEIVVANRDHPAARAAASAEEARRFLVWSRFPFFEITDLGDRYAVRLDDLRFGNGARASWAAVYVEVIRSADGNLPTIARTESDVSP